MSQLKYNAPQSHWTVYFIYLFNLSLWAPQELNLNSRVMNSWLYVTVLMSGSCKQIMKSTFIQSMIKDVWCTKTVLALDSCVKCAVVWTAVEKGKQTVRLQICADIKYKMKMHLWERKKAFKDYYASNQKHTPVLPSFKCSASMFKRKGHSSERHNPFCSV